MKENFEIKIPNSLNLNTISKILIAFIISVIIVFPILNIFTPEGIVSIIILFLIIYIIILSLSGSDPYELPIYPTMPHIGLDGISLDNYMAGMNINNINRIN
jgi:hypothetical protein